MSLKDFPEPESYEDSKLWYIDVLKWRKEFRENVGHAVDEVVDKAAEEVKKDLKRKFLGGKN